MAAIDFEDVRISCEDGQRIASAILRKTGMSGNDTEAHKKTYQAVRDAIQTEMID